MDPALHCPICGYNLTGLPENRCPECGQPFSPAVVARQREGGPFPWTSRILVITTVPVLVVLTGLLFAGVARLEEFAPLLIIVPAVGVGATSVYFARRMIGQLRVRSELVCASTDLQYQLAWVLMFVLAVVWQIGCTILLFILMLAAGELW